MTPGGILDNLYDQYGNRYDIKKLAIGSQTVVYGGSTVSRLTVPSCSSGYFQLYLDSACGLDNYLHDSIQMARLQVVCQVLHDISAFVHSPCTSTGQKVNVWVRNSAAVGLPSYALAEASSFFNLPIATSVSGIVDNTVWQTIVSGKDAYSGVVSPLGSTGGFFHCMMAFNSSTNWNTSLISGPSSSQFDFYTTILHEMMHALGIYSMIDSAGTSNLGYPYFSRYDQFIESGTTHVITQPTGTCNPMYNYSFTAPLSVLHPNPADTTIDTTVCSTALQFVGSSTLKIYTPDSWKQGSSISHFEDGCPPISNRFRYYLMGYGSLTGRIQRYLRPEERHVLCDIGYNVDTVFGSSGNFNLNYVTYSGGMCSGVQVAGVTDGIDSSGSYSYVAPAGTAVTINSSTLTRGLLSNDVNADSISCLQVVAGGTGSFNTTSGTSGTTITYTPAAATPQGIQLLRYVPVNRSTGKTGNITYVFIRVSSTACSGSSCNMIVNGGFESGTGCGQIPAGYTTPSIDCWDYYTGAADIYSTTCVNPGLVGYIYSGIPMLTTVPPTYVHLNSTYPNDRFVGLFGAKEPDGTFNEESLQTTLTSGITTGNTYSVKFWVKNVGRLPYGYNYSIDSPTHIQFCGSAGTLVPLGGFNTVPNPRPANIIPLKDTLVAAADTQWHPYSLTFTYTGTPTLNNLIIINASSLNSSHYPSEYSTYILLDDVSLSLVSPVHFTPPDTLTTCDTLKNLTAYLTGGSSGAFTGNGVILNSGTYSFVPAIAAAINNVGLETIIYRYTDANSCPQQIIRQIYVKNSDTTLTVSASPSIACDSQQITLTASASGIHYTWYPATGISCDTCAVTHAYPRDSTLYAAIITGSNHCPSVAMVNVPVPDTALVVASSGYQSCSPANPVNLDAGLNPYALFQGSPNCATCVYQWYRNDTAIAGANSIIYPADTSGNYKVTININGLCTFTSPEAAVAIGSPHASIIARGPLSVCIGDTVLLKVSPTNYFYNTWSIKPAGSNSFLPAGVDTTVNAYRSGIYAITVKVDIGGCTATAYDTVTIYDPNAAITPSGTVNVCPSSTVILNADTGSGYSYVWRRDSVTIPAATAVSYTVSTAGNYSVKVTDSHGCTDSSAITSVVVVPLALASISPSGTVGICASTGVTLTATPGTGYTYVWQVNTGSGWTFLSYSSFNAKTVYTTGMYRVIISNSANCADTSAATTIISTTDSCAPCNLWVGYGYTTLGSITAGTVTMRGTYYVTGSDTITGNSTFSAAYVFLAPGAKIYVVPGASLTINNSHFFSCGTHMWGGISTTGGSVTVSGSLIQDADTAIVVNGSGTVTSTNSIFNKNLTGICVENMTSPSSALNVTNTVFTSRNLGSTIFSWPTVSTFEGNITTQNSYPYESVSYGIANCDSGGAAKNGIYLSNLGSTNVSAYPYTFNEITVGNSSRSSYLNVFDNLVNGVTGSNANVTLLNNEFIRCSYGVYYNSNTKNYNDRLRLWNNGTAQTNTFYDCINGVNVIDAFEVIGLNTYMISNHTNSLVTRGAYGFNLSGGLFHDVHISNNKLINLTNAISVVQPLDYYVYLLNTARYTPPLAAGRGAYITYDTILAVPDTVTISNGEFTKMGINVQSVLGSGYQNAIRMSPVYCNNNHIHDVTNGILVNNIYQGSTSIDSNYVQERYVSPALQAGIFMFHSAGNIKENNVVGVGNSSTYEQLRGVYTDYNSSINVSCNTTNNLREDFEFVGLQGFHTQWTQNTMENSGKGFVLNGVTGTYYSSGWPYLNTWVGGPAVWNSSNNGWQTYNAGGYSPSLSTLFVDAANNPIYNSGVSGILNAYSTSNGIDTTTATHYMPACTPVPTSVLVGSYSPSEQIAHNAIIYGSNEGITRWQAQMQLYQNIRADSSSTDSSAVLQAFFNDAAGSRYAYIGNIQNYLVEGYLDSAKNLIKKGVTGDPFTDYITGVQIADSSVADGIVSNYKSFYGSFINYLTGNMTNTDSATVTTIAGLCPMTNGAVVYEARALYAILYNDLTVVNDDACYTSPHGREAPKQNGTTGWQNLQNVNLQQQNYRLYPNPTDGLINIVQAIPDSKPIQAEIWNAEGKRMYKESLLFTSGSKKIDLKLTPGLYMLQLTDSQGEDYTLKFVVN